MKNPILYPILMLAACLLAGCDRTPEISVQGTIRDYKTTEAVSGVIIKLSIYNIKHVDDSQYTETTVLQDTTDENGQYQFYYEGDFDSGRLFCGETPSGYAKFQLYKKLNKNESYNLDMSVYPLDSYIRILAKNKSTDGSFNGILMGGISDNIGYAKTFSFDPFLLAGDSLMIDSIPICGDMNYSFYKYNTIDPYDRDTIFCPFGFSEVVIKI